MCVTSVFLKFLYVAVDRPAHRVPNGGPKPLGVQGSDVCSRDSLFIVAI